MPQIPLPPSANPGAQQARSIPESNVQTSGTAFGSAVGEAKYRGAFRVMEATEQAAKAEANMWNTAIRGVTNVVGEQLQKDWKLEAEAELHDLKLGIERDEEGRVVKGDGSSVKGSLENFDARASKLLEGSAVPFKSNILREGIQKLRFQHESAAVAREAGARKQARVDQANKLVEGAEIAIFRDPASLDTLRESTVKSINDSALTSAQKAKLIESTDQRLHKIALEKHLLSGNVGAAQAMLANDRTIAALGGLESVRAQARVSKAAEEASQKAASVKLLTDAAEGKVPLNPYDPAHRKMVDKAFEATGVPQLLAAQDPNAPEQIANIGRRFGIVPDRALDLLTGMAASGSPEQKAYALQTAGVIEAARPGALEQTGAHKRLRSEADDFAFLVSGQNGLGLTPEDAIKRIEEKRTPEFQAKAAARKADLETRELLKSRRKNAENELATAFKDNGTYLTSTRVGNPRDKAVLEDTYVKAFAEHYARTGDEQMAVAAALKDIKRVHGVSSLSGDGTPRLVRNPPELRYSKVEGGHDWIKSQAVASIKAETGRDVKPTDVFFESTRETELALSRGGISAGYPPPYAVYWVETAKDGSKSYQTMPGKLFYPDQSRAQQDAISRAQGIRDQNAGRSAATRAQGATSAPVNAVDPARAVAASVASERALSARAMEQTRAKAESAEAAKAAAPKRNPRADAVEGGITSLIDIFGFGARAQ